MKFEKKAGQDCLVKKMQDEQMGEKQRQDVTFVRKSQDNQKNKKIQDRIQ